MKNKWHDIIRKRLKDNRKECLECLRSGDYSWGDKPRTLLLLNKILKGIPKEAWPDKNSQVLIASNNWSICLSWDYDRYFYRLADLRYNKDDHTAWVKESRNCKGKWIDYDIGGS